MKWEYKMVSLPTTGGYPIEDIMNEYGDHGWELVSSSIVSGLCTLIFKRPNCGIMRTRTKL